MTSVFPVSLKRSENRQLAIVWTDGLEQEISFRKLRDSCQCATCMEKLVNPKQEESGTLKILTPAEARPLEIVSMSPVGNYAYNIQFSDGHSSGIFSFELIRSL